MTSVEALKEIETKLRQPETDRQYLAGQLVVLASIIAMDDRNETGLIKGALGGLQYTIDRLREIWRDPNQPAKSLEELKEIFADVELSRFVKTTEEIEQSRVAFRNDCMLVDLRQIELSDGETFYVFSSKKDQTTVDGRKIMKNEIMDPITARVPSFSAVYQSLLKEKGLQNA